MTSSDHFSERAAFYRQRATEAESAGDEWQSGTFFILANHFEKMARGFSRRGSVHRSASRPQSLSTDSANSVVSSRRTPFGAEGFGRCGFLGSESGFRRVPSI